MTRFAIADGIREAQAAVQQAALDLIVCGMPPELRGYIGAAERALGAALSTVAYALAEGVAP